MVETRQNGGETKGKVVESLKKKSELNIHTVDKKVHHQAPSLPWME